MTTKNRVNLQAAFVLFVFLNLISLMLAGLGCPIPLFIVIFNFTIFFGTCLCCIFMIIRETLLMENKP